MKVGWGFAELTSCLQERGNTDEAENRQMVRERQAGRSGWQRAQGGNGGGGEREINGMRKLITSIVVPRPWEGGIAEETRGGKMAEICIPSEVFLCGGGGGGQWNKYDERQITRLLLIWDNKKASIKAKIITFMKTVITPPRSSWRETDSAGNTERAQGRRFTAKDCICTLSHLLCSFCLLRVMSLRGSSLSHTGVNLRI